MSWEELEAGAPELALRGQARLEESGLALLGTLRRDGSPRINPIEPHLVGGELLFAAMARTPKADDLERDPRCALHSIVTDPEGGDGELKLYGSAREAADELRDAAGGAWWSGRSREEARVYALVIDEAVFVEWDTARGVMTVKRWTRSGSFEERERSYP